MDYQECRQGTTIKVEFRGGVDSVEAYPGLAKMMELFAESLDADRDIVERVTFETHIDDETLPGAGGGGGI